MSANAKRSNVIVNIFFLFFMYVFSILKAGVVLFTITFFNNEKDLIIT